jgi:hypothetical protein
VDEKKLVQLYKSFNGVAYGKGFTYTKRLSDELIIDRDNIKEKLANKFFDYIIYRKCGGDEGELGDCRKKMEYWDIVEKKYNTNEIIFLYGGDKMVDDKTKNYLLDHLIYHSHKGLCFVRELTTQTKKENNMLLDLKNIDYYYLTYNNGKRKSHMINEFSKYNLFEINPNSLFDGNRYKSASSGFLKMLDIALNKMNNVFKPFVMLEDDVKKKIIIQII